MIQRLSRFKNIESPFEPTGGIDFSLERLIEVKAFWNYRDVGFNRDVRTPLSKLSFTNREKMKSLSLLFIACSVMFIGASFTRPAEIEFTNQTIDLGMVVSDLDASVKFYTEVLGFKEAGGFSVPKETATDAGLTDGLGLEIKVLALGDEKTATKLKLMTPKAKSKMADHAFIHSQLGVSYITLHVADTAAVMTRLAANSVKPIAKSPVELPESLAKGVYLTVVRDPDGNLVELVGPQK